MRAPAAPVFSDVAALREHARGAGAVVLANGCFDPLHVGHVRYLEDARAQLEAANAELTQAEAQLVLANETVRQTEELSAQGLATNLELTDADSRRFSADRALVQKRLQADLAALRAFYAAGGRLLHNLGARLTVEPTQPTEGVGRLRCAPTARVGLESVVHRPRTALCVR